MLALQGLSPVGPAFPRLRSPAPVPREGREARNDGIRANLHFGLHVRDLDQFDIGLGGRQEFFAEGRSGSVFRGPS